MRLALALPVALPVVLACACGPTLEPLPFAPAGEDAAPDPSAFGPFPVGVKTVSFVDDARPAPPNGDGTPRDHEHRTLVTEIWYPADESARGEPGQDYVLFDELPEQLRGDLTPEALGTLHTDAVRDAAPRTDGSGPFPVVMFSHGKGGIRMQSTFYTVALASHGYVVVSPDHEGDTIVDLLETGDVDFTTTADSYIDRPIDIEFIMDELEDDGQVDDLRPIMDFDHMGVTGHSFGALTTMIVAGEDFRIKAGVAQSPVGVALVEAAVPQPLSEYGKPLMIQSGGEDRTLPEDVHAQSLWDNMVAPRAWESLVRAGHFTYSDLCIFDVNAIDDALDIDASNVLDDGCGPENTPPDVAFPLIRDGAVGFFNVHLRGSAGSSKWLKQGALDAIAGGEASLQE